MMSSTSLAYNEPAVSLDAEEHSQELARTQLDFYLASVRDAVDITGDTATVALKSWIELRSAIANLAVPDAAPGPDGELLYAWNKDEHRLELEIFPDWLEEFFYFNRSSNESWDGEYDVNGLISLQLRGKLNIFVTPNG